MSKTELVCESYEFLKLRVQFAKPGEELVTWQHLGHPSLMKKCALDSDTSPFALRPTYEIRYAQRTFGPILPR